MDVGGFLEIPNLKAPHSPHRRAVHYSCGDYQIHPLIPVVTIPSTMYFWNTIKIRNMGISGRFP
jgi:hypothetical protein